jgi:NADH-quinone oxidoreductase subunit J
MSGLALLAAAFGLPAISQPVVFGLIAGIAVVTALAVVLHRNVVIAALFLVLHLLSIAGLYLLLGARFFAAIQVIVYSGAIAVLIVFVIMLLNLGREATAGAGVLSLAFAFVLGVLLVLLLGRAARDFDPGSLGGALAPDPRWGAAARMGEALFGPYFFPFEVVSLVLVAGMIGAILLAKRRVEG